MDRDTAAQGIMARAVLTVGLNLFGLASALRGLLRKRVAAGACRTSTLMSRRALSGNAGRVINGWLGRAMSAPIRHGPRSTLLE